MDHQIQCPNCGGYKVDVTSTESCLGIIFRLIAFCFFFIPGLIIGEHQKGKDWESFWKGDNSVECQLCHFKFYKSQIPLIPVQPNTNLINIGQQKLEEEKLREMTAGWLYNQRNNRK